MEQPPIVLMIHPSQMQLLIKPSIHSIFSMVHLDTDMMGSKLQSLLPVVQFSRPGSNSLRIVVQRPAVQLRLQKWHEFLPMPMAYFGHEVFRKPGTPMSCIILHTHIDAIN